MISVRRILTTQIGNQRVGDLFCSNHIDGASNIPLINQHLLFLF